VFPLRCLKSEIRKRTGELRRGGGRKEEERNEEEEEEEERESVCVSE
jgi:hypothetical protein